MLWIIFTVWFILGGISLYLGERTKNIIFGIIYMVSLPIMFYVPFFLK